MGELTYRDFAAADFDALHAMMSHWPIVRQLGGWPWPPVPAFTRSRCQPYDGDGFVWAVCDGDQLVGTVGVTKGDLGYALAPAYQGRGIMPKASRHAISHAFATQDLELLTASTWWDNAASYGLLCKLGFRHWQTRYVRSKARGVPTLCNELRLTRTDWDRLRSAAQ